jgi:hypothetical protein
VWLHAGAHVQVLLNEFETFPNGAHDDQADAAAMAFARLTKGLGFVVGMALMAAAPLLEALQCWIPDRHPRLMKSSANHDPYRLRAVAVIGRLLSLID